MRDASFRRVSESRADTNVSREVQLMDLTFTRGALMGLKRFFFVSAAAVCLAGSFFLVSCGDDGATTRQMTGYLLAQNPAGILECVSEHWNIAESADGTISAATTVAGRRFETAGYRAENRNEGRAGTEIFAVGYSTVDSDGGNRRNPGVVYLQKTSESPARYGGLWIGKHNQPGDGRGIVAVCPYVAVPDPDDMPAEDCPSAIDEMLGDTCYLLDDGGFVDVASPVGKGEAVR